MRKKILKKVVLLFIPLAMFFAVFADNGGDCSTRTIFWGESCCVYSGTSSTGGTVLKTKCCEYIFWIVGVAVKLMQDHFKPVKFNCLN